ncbi:uncharacterized protein LOC120336768 [Styela clava]
MMDHYCERPSADMNSHENYWTDIHAKKVRVNSVTVKRKIGRRRTSTDFNMCKTNKLYHNPNLMSIFWISFLVIHLCAFASTNAENFGIEIEPSQKLFDIDLEKLDDIDDFSSTPTRFDSFGTNSNIGGRNLHMFAVTGHVFNRSLAEELLKFDKGVMSEGDTLKVHFPTSQLPDYEWMVFREDSGLLQGVPLPRHEGVNNIYVTITHVNTPTKSSLTLPCTIEVVTEKAALGLRQELSHLPRLKIDTLYICPHHEPVAMATVVMEVDPSALSFTERLRCLLSLSSFLGVPCKDVTLLSPENSIKKESPFLSGPGNVPKFRTHRGDRDVSDLMTLSWPLGCSSDIIGDIPGLDKLETTAIDGSLAQAIGYGVVEWQIVNKIHQVNRVHRTKRQVGNADSPYPRRSNQGETEETELINPSGARSRVAVNMIRPSAVVGIPIMASKMVTPPLARTQKVVPPHTPYITKPSRSKTRAPPQVPTNEAPMMLFGMENVKAIEGTYMEFRIPQDTFIDQEEGMTRNLELQVMDLVTNKFIQNDGDFPLFDQGAQLIYGVPDENAPADREYMLAAKDSQGKSGSINFSIFVNHNVQKKPESHKYTFVFSDSPEFGENEMHSLYSSFGKKLSVALAKSENMPGVLSIIKSGKTKNGERFITWFDREFNDKLSCHSAGIGIKREANLMIGKDASTGKNKPAKEFAMKFKPEYRLKSIKIELLGPCEGHTTTTITTTTTMIPTTTTSIASTDDAIVEPTVTIPATLSFPTTTVTTTKSTTTQTSTMKPDMTTSKMGPRIEKSLPKLQTEVGKIVKFIIPPESFATVNSDELELRLDGGTPVWLGLEARTRTLYIMPTADDFASMDLHNSTHHMWKGGIIARNKEGVDSEALPLEIYVQEGTSDKDMKANHKFQLNIKNYEPTNFTSIDRIRLIELICDIFGDEDASSIYVWPLRKGSLLFSWHNTTLAYIDPCPFKKIAAIGSKLFAGNTFEPKVKERFKDNNFTVQNVNLSRPSWCELTPNTTPKDRTTAVNVAVAGNQGKSTTIIIIAVVVVCLVLLIIILVLKCRMGKKATAKKQEIKEKHDREEAAIAAGNPELLDTPRIKKGVPIIFQDEIAMEPNGNANASPSTPLIAHNHRGNGENRSPAIVDDDQIVHEETQFTSPVSQHPMTPPTPIMSGRPPPPYIKSR